MSKGRSTYTEGREEVKDFLRWFRGTTQNSIHSMNHIRDKAIDRGLFKNMAPQKLTALITDGIVDLGGKKRCGRRMSRANAIKFEWSVEDYLSVSGGLPAGVGSGEQADTSCSHSSY